jgi:RNA ligase (TIGR02306 family)
MSSFTIEAHKLTITDHPNADALELARVGGFVSCVPSGVFKTGDVALYIPEAALVPEKILADMNLLPDDGGPIREGKPIGRGSGGRGNRVKAIKLRQQLSQGLVYKPAGMDLVEGHDYAEELGIKKWIPEVPMSMDGKAEPVSAIKSNSDPENVKKVMDVLIPGEEVVVSEKIHGSACIIHFDGERVVASSKNVAKQGLGLIDEKDEHGRSKNLYWQVAHKFGLIDKLPQIAQELNAQVVTLYGEAGACQDLKYGRDNGDKFFCAFDIRVDGRFLDFAQFSKLMERYEIEVAPVLYVGPYSPEVVAKHTDGLTVFGNGAHIREGVVVKSTTERLDPQVGRVILKSISEAYILRANATEYN